MGAERRVRQGQADLTLHIHQRPEGVHHHIGEDGLPRARRQNSGHGHRLAGRTGSARLHRHGREDAGQVRHRAVGGVQDHQVFLQDTLRHEED